MEKLLAAAAAVVVEDNPPAAAVADAEEEEVEAADAGEEEDEESDDEDLLDLDDNAEEERKDEVSSPIQNQQEEQPPEPALKPAETFHMGLYTVKRGGWLREELDTSSKKLRKINTGEFVNITEVLQNAEGTRIRGKVGNDGFMTLQNLENGNVCVKLIRKVQETQKQEEDEDSSVEITESDEEEQKAERPDIMADWENDHVLSWIETMPSLRKYSEDFEIGEVDGDDLISFTDDDLKQLGIDSSVHRKLLLSAVKKYLEG